MNTDPAPPLPHWLETMLPAGARRYCVDVGGQRMAFMEVGSGAPVLMVHGNPTWGFLYRKVAAELSGEDLRLIMPDLVGLGFSDKPASAMHTLDNHAAWLAAGIDALELEEVTVVAQDWGGPIALLGVDASAASLAGMVMMNTVVSPPKEGFRPTLFHRASRWPVLSELLFRIAGFPQNALFLAQGDRRSIRGDVARAYRYPLRDRRRSCAPLALARMVPDSLDHPSVPALRRCQSIYESFDGPVALVWGMRDPILGRVVGHLNRLQPAARVTKTEAGHFLQEEVPREIADAVRFVTEDLGAK